MATSHVSSAIYQRLRSHPRIGASMIIYSLTGTLEHPRSSVFSAERFIPEGLCLPSTPSPFASGRQHIVQLYGDYLNTAFREDGGQLIDLTSGSLVAFVMSGLYDVCTTNPALGRVYVRSAKSLFIWADTPDQVINVVFQILALPIPSGYEGWADLRQFLNLDVFASDEEAKLPLPELLPPDAGLLFAPVAMFPHLECQSPTIHGARLDVPPQQPYAHLQDILSSPHSSGGSARSASASISAPSSTTASPRYPLTTLTPSDVFSPLVPSGRLGRLRGDDSDDPLDDSSFKVPLSKRLARSKLSGRGSTFEGTAETLNSQQSGATSSVSHSQADHSVFHNNFAPDDTQKVDGEPRARKARKSSSRKPKTRSTKRQKWPCPHCHIDFTRAQDLQRHIDSSCVASRVYAESPSMGYRCEICGEVLSRKDAAKRHLDNKSCFKSRRKSQPPRATSPPTAY